MYNIYVLYFSGFVFFICSFCIIFSNKPGFTILFFIIIVMIQSSWLFFLTLEFLAFSLFYIYIGGIMVLFIFLVMMLGDFYPRNFMRKKFQMANKLIWFSYICISLLFCIFFLYIILYFWNANIFISKNILSYTHYISSLSVYNDLTLLGHLLFNFFFFWINLNLFYFINCYLWPDYNTTGYK